MRRKNKQRRRRERERRELIEREDERREELCRQRNKRVSWRSMGWIWWCTIRFLSIVKARKRASSWCVLLVWLIYTHTYIIHHFYIYVSVPFLPTHVYLNSLSPPIKLQRHFRIYTHYRSFRHRKLSSKQPPPPHSFHTPSSILLNVLIYSIYRVEDNFWAESMGGPHIWREWKLDEEATTRPIA